MSTNSDADKSTQPSTSINAVPTEASPQDIAELVRREVKRQADEDGKGLFAKVKSWGLVLGLVGALFAIPKGIIDLNNAWADAHKAPRTEAQGVDSLVITYDPIDKNLEFAFEASLSNDGEKSDVIKNVNGDLIIGKTETTPLLTFQNSNTFLIEAGKEEHAIIAPRGEAKVISIRMRNILSDSTKATLSGGVSPKLVVDLIGNDGSHHRIKYCFDLGKMYADEFFNSNNRASRPFVNTLCQ